MKSKFRKILQLVLAVVMVASFSLCLLACGEDDNVPTTKSYEFTMRVGETKMLDFYAVSEGATYELTVSDTSVLSVDKLSGVVSALKVGSSVITQTYADKTATYSFTVQESNFVPEVLEDGVKGDQDLDINAQFIKTTVGGISNITTILKNVEGKDLTWSIAEGGNTIVKITPSSDNTSCVIEGLSVGETSVYLSNGVIKDVLKVEVGPARDTHEHDSNKDTVVKLNYTSIKTQVGAYATLELVTDLDVNSAVWTNSQNAIVNLDFTQGNKTVFLSALAIGEATIKVQIGDYYAECVVVVASDTLEKLGTVSLTLTDNVLSWNAIPNATGYEYSVDGGYKWDEVINQGNNPLTHEIDSNFPAGKYDFMVRAKGDGISYRSGDADSKSYITSLYSTFNAQNKTLTWYMQDGEDAYTIHVDGLQPFVVNSGDYVVSDRTASIVVPDVVRNEDIYVSTIQKDGNVVNYISSDLGLVVIYSGVGNSNPNVTFKADLKVLSVKVDGVEKTFVQEDGKVTLTDYVGIAYGEKVPFVIELENGTIESNIIFVPRVLYAGANNYVSPDANFINNLNTHYHAKYKDINKIADKQYELVENDATELTFTVGDVTISRLVEDMIAKGNNYVETVFVRLNENAVEKVRIGLATAFIEDGDQLANLTYIANPIGKWKNRTCHSCGNVWNMSNDVVVDGEIICQKEGCGVAWDATKDGRFGKIFSYGTAETFVLKNDIDYFGQKAVYEAETFGNLSLSSYNSWGFQGVIDGNGHSVYNASDRLIGIISYTSVIKNLGVYANVSSSNILSRFNINGTIDNCYFDIYVTKQAGAEVNAVTDINVTHEGDNVPVLKNSFINVTIDPECSQHVYAIAKNVTGANFSQTIVATTYSGVNAMYNETVGEPAVAPTLVGGDVSESEIKAFLAQPGINHGAFRNDNGTLKFYFTRPEEISVDLIYPLYKFNADYNGRVANTSDLVVEGYDYDDIPASTFEGKRAGDMVSVLLEKVNGKIVTANIRVVTGAISTAKEFSNMIYLSADTRPTQGWTGYYVLTNNIDMQGYNMLKGGRPGTLFNSGGWGFQGTIDGAGYTVFNLNDTMFLQLGNWVGTIKNLSLINMTKPLATTLGGLTIDNCYFQFVLDTQHVDGAPFTHVLGDSIGDGYPRDVVISNSVFEVINNTGVELKLINKINDVTQAGYEGRYSTLTYKNTLVVLDTAKVGVGATYGETAPTVVAEGSTYTGDVSGFSDVLWFKEGKFPTFNSFIDMGTVNKKFAYGRFTTVDGVRVENTAPFVGEVREGVTVSWDEADDILLAKDAHGNFKLSPGYSVETMLKGSDGRYYKVNVTLASVAINNAYELKHLMTTLAGENNYTPGGSQTIMLNGDIDMEGVTDIVYSKSTQGAGSWGFIGTFDGNGYTISNLEVPLFIHTNYACTIKNVTFKNIKEGGAVTNRSSGAILENVKFDIDADGMSSVYLFAKDNAARMALTMKDCEINVKNVTSATNIYVQGGLSPQYDVGSMSVTNVKVVTNAGNFYFGSYNSTTDLNRTGAVNETFTGSVTVPGV